MITTRYIIIRQQRFALKGVRATALRLPSLIVSYYKKTVLIAEKPAFVDSSQRVYKVPTVPIVTVERVITYARPL